MKSSTDTNGGVTKASSGQINGGGGGKGGGTEGLEERSEATEGKKESMGSSQEDCRGGEDVESV